MLFYEGVLFESTLNYKSKIRERCYSYSQSQLLIMLDVPTIDQVNKKAPIEMYAAKAGVNHIDVRSGVPSKEDLVDVGWTPLKVNAHQVIEKFSCWDTNAQGNSIRCGILVQVP